MTERNSDLFANWSKETWEKIARYTSLKVSALENDERAAAILLRNPSNFDALVDAFEKSPAKDLRGRLDDALSGLARSGESQ